MFQSDSSQEEEYGSDHPDELASLNSCTQVHSSTKGAAANVLNTVKDLHLEMIMTYHRITIRLAAFTPQGMHPCGSSTKFAVIYLDVDSCGK